MRTSTPCSATTGGRPGHGLPSAGQRMGSGKGALAKPLRRQRTTGLLAVASLGLEDQRRQLRTAQADAALQTRGRIPGASSCCRCLRRAAAPAQRGPARRRSASTTQRAQALLHGQGRCAAMGTSRSFFKKDLVRQARQPLAPALLVQPLAPAPQQLVLLGQLTDSPAASAVLEGTAKGLGLSGRHQVLPRLPYSPRTRTAPAPKAARSQNANASTRLSAAAPAVVPLQHALHATRPCRVKPWQLA